MLSFVHEQQGGVRMSYNNNLAYKLPNAISLMRAGLAPIVMLFALWGKWGMAFPLLLIATMSDAVDGFVAKKLGVKSEPNIDPICDLILVVFAVAGALFTGKLNLVIFGFMIVLAVVIQLILFIPRWFGRLSRFYSGIAATNFICTIFAMNWLYAYQAYGYMAHWMVWISIPFLAALAYLKRHRIQDWVRGKDRIPS